VTFDKLNDKGLLKRGDTTTDDSLAPDSQVQELLLKVAFKGISEGLAVDD
jgi:hypothetical protein